MGCIYKEENQEGSPSPGLYPTAEVEDLKQQLSLRERERESMEDVCEMRTRSFRDEDYNNRRVFLRSYPLQWEQEEELDREGEEEEVSKLLFFKSRLIAVFHWSEGKFLLLRRLKDKLAFYLVACHPFGFKSSNKLITV